MKGLNQFRWDLVTKENESNLPYFIHYKEYLGAGDYRVILSAGGLDSEQDWHVGPGKIPHTW